MDFNKKRNSPYLKATSEIVEEASELVGLNPEEGANHLDAFFMVIKDVINNDDRMPTLKMPIMGYFKPTLGGIRRTIRIAFRMYRAGRIPKKVLDYRIKKWWWIRDRIIREKRGENMWQLWRNIPRDWRKKDKEFAKLEKEVIDYYRNNRTPKSDY